MRPIEELIASLNCDDPQNLTDTLVAFFDLSSDAVLILDNTLIKGCNSRFCELLEKKKEDFTEQDLKNIIYPDDLDHFLTFIKNPYSESEAEVRFKKNNFLSLRFKAKSTKFDLQNTTFHLVVLNYIDNITQIRNNLSIVLEAANEGYWDWDVQTGEVFYDKQWLKILGYTEENLEIHDKFWEEKIHPDDKAHVMRDLELHFRNLKPYYHTEHRLLNKYGEYIWVLDIGKIIERDGEDRPRRIAGVTLDINKRHKIEERLVYNEERFRSIFEHLSDGFCRFNFMGEILEANEIMTSLLDLAPGELIHRSIQEFLPPKAIKTLMKLSKQIIRSQSIITESEIISVTGRKIPVSISAKLIIFNGEFIIQALVRDITNLKEVEKALFEEKQKFKLLVENSPEMILRVNRNLQILYASPNFHKIITLPDTEITGRKLKEIGLPENNSSYIEQTAKRIFKKPKTQIITTSLISGKDEMLVEAILSPEKNESGVIESLLITFRDITEKMATLDIAKASQKRLEDAEKIVHFANFEFNFQTNKIDCSSELYSMFEFEIQPELVTPENFMNSIHPDDKKFVLDYLGKTFSNKTSSNLNFRIITPNGTEKYIQFLSEYVLDEQNNPVRLNGIILDITEKLQIQRLFTQESESLRIIMENVPDAIYFKNANGQYLRANIAFCKLLQVNSPDEIIGKTDFELVEPDLATEYFNEDQQIILSGTALIDKQHSVKTSSGETLWLSTTKIGIKNAEGKTTQIVGISRDITQYVLSELKLKEAKDRAEQADRLKSAFLANMSHEIRTPINGILGFASLMELKEFPREKEKQYLSIINNSGKLLLNLINDIIDIAKMEAGQISIDKSVIELNGLMNELFYFFQAELARKDKAHIDINMLIPTNGTEQYIFSDITRLKQILNNLLYNSLKFTDQGKIEFGYRKQPASLLFYVKDTGIGLSESEKEIVFERFKQAGMGSRKKEGTGLGLAISKGLVELMGGRIWVESYKNCGSTFYFTLPDYEADGQMQLPKKNIEIAGLIPNWQDFTVLLVEDEEANYLYTNELLSESNVKLLHAKSGEEAISFCQNNNSIALVLLDIRLPGINGFEALSEIRKNKPSLPIIAQTAFAMENERKTCLDLGCNDYISKPFDQSTLYHVLSKYLMRN